MSAPAIIKRLRVHRTSVYPPLDSLFAKGLISKEASGKQVLFTITNPDQSLRALLDETVNQKKQALTDMEVTFSSFIKQLPHASSKRIVETEAETKFYKGVAGVKKSMRRYCKQKNRDRLLIAQRLQKSFLKTLNYSLLHLILTRKLKCTKF